LWLDQYPSFGCFFLQQALYCTTAVLIAATAGTAFAIGNNIELDWRAMDPNLDCHQIFHLQELHMNVVKHFADIFPCFR
jgi:hypothetical protein